MQPTTAVKPDLDAAAPTTKQEPTSGVSETKGVPETIAKSEPVQNGATTGQFPPPKTDKPRPHVCGTCGRSFARLEHLKRHERSHTKEKPFECPECTRCFARRDLLLRHQQKLHMTNTTSTRPKASRRESVGGTSVNGGGRVRKNSVANMGVGGSSGLGGVQPTSRRNTISHIDLSSLGLMDGTTMNMGRFHAPAVDFGPAFNGLAAQMGFDYRGMSNASGHHGNIHGLPKLDMSAVNNFDMHDSLRTAPPMGSFANQVGFDLDQLFSPGTTINPAQLHFGGPVSTMAPQYSNFEAYRSQHPMIPEGDDYSWMRSWNMQIQSGQDGNEQAIDESSPSRISGDSPGDYNESMNGSHVGIPMPNSNFQWSQTDIHSQLPLSAGGPFHLDALGSGLPNLDLLPGAVSPNTLHDSTLNANAYFEQAMQQQNLQQKQSQAGLNQTQFQGQGSQNFSAALSNFSSDSPSHSSSSMTSSARQSSVTSVSTESITDATRQALLNSLSQPSMFGHGHRKFSQPSVSSPLSPGVARNSTQGPNLPCTADIRRYVDAFIQFAHPHMPVVHIPSLSFDAVEYCSSIRSSPPQVGLNQASITGGGGCLILAMAAIGALYEYDHPASKELFEAGKKMIGLYLEERRKADMSAAVNGGKGHDNAVQHTPIWLVHAMLLNVIYGHQCGDKTAADIASNHCAALVSLARAADLAHSPTSTGSPDVDMGGVTNGHSGQLDQDVDLQTQWLEWKTVEERKRTFFAIFNISSLLTTAYNQTPTIMNSEIQLDLPCDEELWFAETAQEWHNRGGLAAAEANAISFADALSTLLTANQRQGSSYTSGGYSSNNPHGVLRASDASSDTDLRPSTFGCLVLINALHNYIWETRSRHHGREWTAQETESMFSHIEPALNAWQAAWKANDHHKLERPNPFGLGPLSADSIPLLDLAFVRLFVNLGRSKEAFWRRDFDTMADELARGDEIVQHAAGSPPAAGDREIALSEARSTSGSPPHITQRRASRAQPSEQASSRRERHLRKAAFYAADSLTIACSYNLTYADLTAHELPVQSAMCFFDCSQVLAEWVSTVQERVGRYLGVLGRDSIDYAQVPAIMLLETEDVELLRKIESICDSLEAKRFQQENLLAMDLQTMNPLASMNNMRHHVNLSTCGYGSKILRVTMMMLEKAVVWPVTHVMAKGLETQAAHMDQRADASCTQ